MDNHSQFSKRVLPNTPRVNAKIIEYYQKFGQDRDLEKFMRLHSPASSQDSQKTQGDDCVSALDSCCKRTISPKTNSSSDICEALAMMQQRPLSVCYEANSKSMPNIDVQEQPTSEKGYLSANEVIGNINTEKDLEKEKILSLSTENVKTPQKNFKNSKTQTPESVAKTHRRLEWDSLADVGYKKSMSTSNISTLEKSLLREFFKEKSALSEPGTSVSTKDDQNITKELKTLCKLKENENGHSTPPLACSTLITKTKGGMKPKMISQSTSSTSLHKKFEKYAQTSVLKPPTVRTQETQCNMSSSNSIIEGTITPSSFEYYSSKSSKSSDFLVNTETQNQFKPLEHPFITSIRDLLIRRKALGEKNEQNHHQLNNMCELQTKFQSALYENKENRSHSTPDSATVTSFSLSKQAPELDLGIQLICSLVEAKSINATQKRQLIRDIIKRITRLQAGGLTSNSTTVNSSEDTTINSADCHHQIVCNSLQSNINNKNKQHIMTKSRATFDLGVSPIAEQVNVREKSSSTTNTSDSFNDTSATRDPKQSGKLKPSNFPKSHHFPQHPNKNAALINKETQSEVIMIYRSKDKSKQTATNHKLSPKALDTKYLTKLKENKRNVFTTNSISSTSSTSSTKTSDLATQKCIASNNNDRNNSNTDAEQPTMQEWLNPLTQSEIEYEEKKQLEMKKKLAAQQERLSKQSKHDCGRVQQISWIENEMKRLACLKHLLLKDETPSKSSLSSSSHDNFVQNDLSNGSIQTDKLYDTVCSEKSSVLSESAEQLVQEIEIILEESHEDIINLKDNLKRSKNRKKETQIIYKKEEDSLKKNKTKVTPKLRIINENINFHEEQLLNANNAETNSKQSQQREKIDTPSTDKSQESESLKELVQQKKREFMESYKLKKQHNYEALKQQQKGDFKYLNTQRPSSLKTTTSTDSEHYSLPYTLPRIYVSNDVPYYTQHPLPLTPSEREATLKPPVPLREHNLYKTTLTGQQENSKSKSDDIYITTSSVKTTTTTTDSEHYSVPHTQPRKYVSNDVSYYAQHPLPLTPLERAARLKPNHFLREHIANSAISAEQHQKQISKPNSHEIIITSSSNTNNTPTTSSSSMFCMSSDVSVPMGSQNTSSTSTTTHQYDDVATAAATVGVAVQTSDSILRSKPIFGPKPTLPTLIPNEATTTSSATACIQVKPKGIAYVIEFDDNTHAISNLSSNTDINSNDLHTKSSTKSLNSATTAVTNNLKPSLPTEPSLTLQEHLERSKPIFLQRTKERKLILNQLQSMRQDRDRQLREIIGNTSFNSLDKRLKHLPPPPIQKVRILKTKEMKALTNKRFAKLPEVVAKKEREIEEKKRRSNRILRDVFNRRMQKRVRNGKLSLNHSKTVI